MTWDPGLVVLGGVVPVTVTSPVDLMAADAFFGGERFPLLPAGNRSWVALVGVSTKRKDPSLPVDLSLFPAKGGPPYRIRADLMIREPVPGKREVQELALPAGMVDLSERRIRQVRSDNRSLGDSLATRTRERFWRDGFVIPVEGRISTRFGTGRVLNGKPRSSHSGVDVAAGKGAPILASNSGKVLLAYDFYLSGKTVVVDHGWGICTIYGHMDQIGVREGQRVERGQAIGTVGTTGRATGPHLHFGAFIRGVKVNPLKLIEVTRDFTADRKIP
ncbi:MAG: M23 family metallopeptidase [bacterium]|nr:M23 family metallopeptidase [bacterium]MDT8395049.1 M23 family metallopeptidase [bacterium]